MNKHLDAKRIREEGKTLADGRITAGRIGLTGDVSGDLWGIYDDQQGFRGSNDAECDLLCGFPCSDENTKSENKED